MFCVMNIWIPSEFILFLIASPISSPPAGLAGLTVRWRDCVVNGHWDNRTSIQGKPRGFGFRVYSSTGIFGSGLADDDQPLSSASSSMENYLVIRIHLPSIKG